MLVIGVSYLISVYVLNVGPFVGATVFEAAMHHNLRLLDGKLQNSICLELGQASAKDKPKLKSIYDLNMCEANQNNSKN